MKRLLSHTKSSRTGLHFRWTPAQIGWLAALGATLVLLVGAFLPPFAPLALAEAVRAGFAPLCHQLAERSFHISRAPLAVCHRCSGIYAGLVVGAALLPAIRDRSLALARHDRWLVLAAVVPPALDWGGDVLGVWTNTAFTQTATGAWFGLLIGVLFARSLSGRRAWSAA